MSHDDEGGCVAAVAFAVLCFIVGCWAGCEVQRATGNLSAISHGAAKYVIVDPVNGRTEFKWNDELTTQGVTR